jgi:hypothetical protein
MKLSTVTGGMLIFSLLNYTGSAKRIFPFLPEKWA